MALFTPMLTTAYSHVAREICDILPAENAPETCEQFKAYLHTRLASKIWGS